MTDPPTISAGSFTEQPNAFWSAALRAPVLLALIVTLIVAAAYLPVIQCDFVNYDDSDYVTANTYVQQGFRWENIRWAFTSGHAANWHPVTWLSHMLDWQLFGSRPAGHHLVNMLLHLGNTVLVFVVFARLTGAPLASLLLAAVFGLHPLHVESVAWVSERKDVLSALFFLLTLGMYEQYVRSKSDPAPGSPAMRSPQNLQTAKLSFAVALFFFALGLMSKPMLVTLPFTLLLLDYWPLQRFQLNTKSSNLKTISGLLLEKLPFVLLSAVSACITFLVQQHGGAVSTSLSLGARLANGVISYARYLGKTFWPVDLSVLYPHPGHWPAVPVIASMALLGLITTLAICLARRRPWWAVGWFWFLGMLIPVNGLVQVGIQSMADRYMYLPILGLLILLIWEVRQVVVASGNSSNLFWSAAGVGLSIAVLLGYFVLTRWQIAHWHNSETLFGHAVRVTKNNYLAYNNLGFYLSERGKIQQATENYRRSLAINPDYEDARNNLGHALAAQKQYSEAIEQYELGLRHRPNHSELHNNLGNALAEIGRVDEAIAHYQVVLAQKPNHADAHNNFGIALAMKGQVDQAIPHFEQAIRFKPDNASAHSNLGNAYAVQHRFEEAAQEYKKALRLKPDEPQAHNNLANVLTEQGRVDEAITHYEEALRLNPDNPEAHYNLGVALNRQGNLDAARSHYSEALRLKPDYLEAGQQLQRLPAHRQQ